jgi:site-specific DNA-cytosine methylase
MTVFSRLSRFGMTFKPLTESRGEELLTLYLAGFPAKTSAAGKGAGITGSRSGLWSEMARIIGEVRPRYAFVENSPMLTSRGLGTVLGDLAALGFDAKWGVVSAADVGAPHLRERIWIVAHAQMQQLEGRQRIGKVQTFRQLFGNEMVGKRTRRNLPRS